LFPCSRSFEFDSDVVIHGVWNRCPEACREKPDLFEFASGLMAETSTANLVGSEPSQDAVGGELLHQGPPKTLAMGTSAPDGALVI
jgi:hypothetical protein